jgi:hypothetical protein
MGTLIPSWPLMQIATPTPGVGVGRSFSDPAITNEQHKITLISIKEMLDFLDI